MSAASDGAGPAPHIEAQAAAFAQEDLLAERRGFRRRLILLMLIHVGILAFMVISYALPTLRQPDAGPADAAILAALTLVAVLALSAMSRYVDRLFTTLSALRQDVVMAALGVRDLPRRWVTAREDDSEIARFAQALARLADSSETRRRLAETRLQTVAEAADQGILVLSRTGLILLANGNARRLLGFTGIGAGHSIFPYLLADDLEQAFSRSEQAPAGRVLTVMLRDHNDRRLKARITLQNRPAGGSRGADYILLLPPEERDGDPAADEPRLAAAAPPSAWGSAGPGPEVSILDLPMVSLGCLTTGGDPGRDRIISLAAVQLQGRRVLHQVCLDRLVNPDRLIGDAATRRHGITNQDVRDEPSFAEVWPGFEAFMSGMIVIGAQLETTLAFLDLELRRAGLSWSPILTLDPLLILQRLEKRAARPDIGEAAAAFDISAFGLGTAMGDALITAELQAALVARLQAEGIDTLERLQDFV